MDQLTGNKGKDQEERAAASALQPAGLTTLLARFRRRLRLRDGWLLAQRSLWLAALAALSVQLAGRLWPIERLWLWSSLPLAAWGLAVLTLSALRPQPLLRVARRCDAELGLKERLATALGLQDWPEQGRSNRPAFQPALVAHQQQDALVTARGIDPRRAFPLRWQRQPLLLAATLLAATAGLGLVPNRMDAILAERAAVAEAAHEQAAQIEKLGQKIEAMKELTPAEREELQRQLAALAEQLQANRGDREEALADLSRLEEALRQKLDLQASGRSAMQGEAELQALEAQLEALAREQAGQQAGLSSMEEALQALAEQAGGLSQAQQQALSQALGQMAAQAAQGGDADLAQALAALGQALQAGDAQAATEAAQNAAAALGQAQSDLAAQAARQQALAQVQGSRQAIAGAGQSASQAAGSAAGQSQGQGPGQGQNQGQGQGQGQGQSQSRGQGQGQAGGGGGTRANTLPPARRTGQMGQPTGAGQPGGTGSLDTQVYVPWERRPGSGQEVTLPGQDTGQGQTETREQRDPLPGTPGEALLPYQQVYYDYLDAANQTVEQSYIPAGLKDYVRAYFSQLEP